MATREARTYLVEGNPERFGFGCVPLNQFFCFLFYYIFIFFRIIILVCISLDCAVLKSGFCTL